MLRCSGISVALLSLALTPAVGAWAAGSAADEFEVLVDQMWQYDLEQLPLFATSVGEHRYNDRLPAVSRADSERRNAAKVAFLARLDEIDRNELTAVDRNSYDILRRQINDGLAEFAFGSYLMPITQRSGFHVDFPELPNDVPLNTLKDYENYIARLRAFGEYADGHIALMREGIAAERMLPAVTLEGWEQAVDAHVTDNPEKSALFAPLSDFPAAIPQGEHERLRTAAREAIATSVVTGYRWFRQFMADEYVPQARDSVGISALPGGRDFYRHRVRIGLFFFGYAEARQTKSLDGIWDIVFDAENIGREVNW